MTDFKVFYRDEPSPEESWRAYEFVERWRLAKGAIEDLSKEFVKARLALVEQIKQINQTGKPAEGADDEIDDVVRCSNCGSLVEHFMTGWHCPLCGSLRQRITV